MMLRSVSFDGFCVLLGSRPQKAESNVDFFFVILQLACNKLH